jgi:diguanylate cyclase (GGDEF)-like protein
VRLVANIIIFTVLIGLKTLAYASELNFKHLSQNELLPSSHVNQITQLSQGFMLFSTTSGARLFDGSQLIEFNVKNNTSSISGLNANVYTALQDSRGDIWFATSLGLYKLSHDSHMLERVSHDPQNSNTLLDDNVRIITQDKQNNLWFGTFKGVSRFNPDTSQFTHFQAEDLSGDPEVLLGLPKVLLQQDQNTMWFGTSTGLYQINPSSRELKRVEGDLGQAYITSALITHSEEIWFGTHGQGIFKLDLSGKLLAQHTVANSPELGFHSDRVWNLFEDIDKKIWIGYWSKGLSVFDPVTKQIHHGVFRQGDKNALPNQYIEDIYVDNSGLVWIASTTGIATFNPINFNIHTLSNIPQDTNSINGSSIFAIEETVDNIVWIATEIGLERWDRQDNSIKHYYHDTKNTNSISAGVVWDLQRIGNHHLLIATDSGLDLLDLQNGKFQRLNTLISQTKNKIEGAIYSIVPKSNEWFYISGASTLVLLFNPLTGEQKVVFDAADHQLTKDIEYYTSLLVTHDGDLWVGSTTGLYKVNLNSRSVTEYSTNKSTNRLSDNHILGLLETDDGSIWVATENGGINKIAIDQHGKQKISVITQQQGLPSNRIHNLRSNEVNRIWFTTDKHLGSLNPLNNHITTHGILKSNGRGYREGAVTLGSNNNIYLGDSRLRLFQPQVLITSQYQPQVRITGVSRLHQTFTGFSPLSDNQLVEFLPTDTLITFEFASLDFASPELTQYRYQLEGHDNKWLYPGTDNRASYTQLPAGHYQLNVQGTNRDGQWSPHIAKLDIIMYPPFYLSSWAYIIYFVSVALILSLVIVWRKNKRKVELANMQVIKQSEARLKDVLWGSGDILWRWELTTNKIYKIENANLAKDSLEQVDDFDTHISKIHPDDQLVIQDKIDRHLKGEEDYYEAQYRMPRPYSNDWEWVLSRGRIVEFNKEGKPLVIAGTIKNINAIKQTEKQLRYLANYDQLTGLANRTLFHKHLDHSIELAKRFDEKVALLYLDLDSFKLVNDTLGHVVGDQLLKAVAERLTKILRSIDRCSRLGGDEFAIIIERVKTVEEVLPTLERLVAEIAEPFLLEEHKVQTTVSIGVAIYPDNTMLPPELLKHADFAMYEAKRNGKKHYQFFNAQMNKVFMHRVSIANELVVALAKQQFETFYQPRVSVKDNQVSGFEALIRWRHPERGLVPPSEFIPIAEESGHILEIGDWVLTDSCLQGAKWYQQGWRGFISVNIAALQFKQSDLVESVKSALANSNLPAQCLELEITESTLIRDIELTRNILLNLKKLGVRIALDDFGTGYSSLAYLQQLPIDVLKIDRSFINRIPDSSKSVRLCTAIINMAHSLELKVVAEGIEQPAQLRFLHEVLCEEYQGFLFAKPMPVSEIDIRKLAGGQIG